MTKSIYGAAALALSAAFSLTSCQSDDPNAAGVGNPVHMKVGINFNADDTRTLLSEVDGNLRCTWEEGDKVWVVDFNGNKYGELTIVDGIGEEYAHFEGTLSGLPSSGSDFVNFIYFGRGVNPTEIVDAAIGHYAYDFSQQQGTLASLSEMDFLYNQCEVELGEGMAYTEDMNLHRRISFGHFELIFPAGVNRTNEPVTISGDNVLNQYTFDKSSSGQTTVRPGEITVSGVNTGNDLYVTIIPTTGIAPTFTVTIGGVKYTGSLAARNWTKSEFVRKSQGVGVPVIMTKDGSGDTGDEDPRNPLTKWAETNLVRVDGLTNGFASSDQDPGALYQWGRNYGYMSTRGIYNESVAIPENYAHFIDAMGTFSDVNAKYARTLDYYVYNPSSSNYFMVSGTAMRYTPDHPQYSLWYDSPKFYTSKQDVIDNPTKYFMDGTPKGRFVGYGNYLIGMEVENYNPDYWLSSFGNGGSTWAERASACGYSSTDPCPDGWRLPTAAEFMEIAPEGSGLDQNATLASMLSNYSELRQTAAGVRYAIRWLYTGSDDAITIEAVVVDDSYTSASQLTSLFWDSNVNNKVVRKFPFTGTIMPLISLCDGYYMANEHIVVRPHHRGFLDYTGFPGGYGPSNNYYWMLIGPADVNDGNKAFGAYWVSDKGKAFKFEAKERSNGKNTSNASFTQTSCMFFGTADPVMGYAIRPVKK